MGFGQKSVRRGMAEAAEVGSLAHAAGGRPKRYPAGPDLGQAIRRIKGEHEGEIEVAGPDLAESLTRLALIDEYRIYLHPVALGQGEPYFAGSPPDLHLIAHDRIDENVLRLTYVPAYLA